MTPEHLELLKELQPLFREKMGEWQDGDNYYDELSPNCINSVCALCDRSANTGDYMMGECLRIPDVYSRDPERPERGLIGMIEGSCLKLHYEETRLDKYKWSVTGFISGNVHCEYGTTPSECLLRAIAWQEEQKEGKQCK